MANGCLLSSLLVAAGVLCCSQHGAADLPHTGDWWRRDPEFWYDRKLVNEVMNKRVCQDAYHGVNVCFRGNVTDDNRLIGACSVNVTAGSEVVLALLTNATTQEQPYLRKCYLAADVTSELQCPVSVHLDSYPYYSHFACGAYFMTFKNTSQIVEYSEFFIKKHYMGSREDIVKVHREYEYTARIVLMNDKNSNPVAIISGCIIHPYHVLTAPGPFFLPEKRVYRVNPDLTFLTAGSDRYNEEQRKYYVVKSHVHPQYDPVTEINALMILIVSVPIHVLYKANQAPDDWYRAVHIPVVDLALGGRVVETAGWSYLYTNKLMNNSDHSTQLRTVTGLVARGVEYRPCREPGPVVPKYGPWSQPRFPDLNFCITTLPVKSTFVGDVGSPIVVPKGELQEATVIGIFLNLKRNFVGVVTKVYPHRTWINNILNGYDPRIPEILAQHVEPDENDYWSIAKVTLVPNDGSPTVVISGAVVHPHWVITAPGPLFEPGTKKLRINDTKSYVTVGPKASAPAGGATELYVKSLRVHPDYDPDTQLNALAMLMVNGDLTKSGSGAPYAIPKDSSRYTFPDVLATGGWRSLDKNPNYVGTKLTVVDDHITTDGPQCPGAPRGRKRGGGNYSASEMCIHQSYTARRVYRGDYGSPLILDGMVVGVLVGQSADGINSVATKTYGHSEWINDNFQSEL